MRVKSSYVLVSTREKIEINGIRNRNGSGDVTVNNLHLLPETREIIYRYQDEFKETHGCAINASAAVNEIILLWAQAQDGAGYPGYDPGLYKDARPIPIGMSVWHKGRLGTFQGYLPGNNVLVQFQDGDLSIKETVPQDEIEVV